MKRNWAKSIFTVVAASLFLGSILQFQDKGLIRDDTNQRNIILILNSHGGGSGRDK